MSDMTSFIQGLPKAELHLHIEGSLEPELRFKLAERNNMPLPYSDIEDMRKGYIFHDLSSFLPVYYDAMAVLQTPQDFYDLAWSYLEKAAAANIRYAEIFFDPQAHTSRGVDFPTVISGLRGAILDARRLLGVRAQLIMCILRDQSATYAMATLLESLPYKDSIIGIGLDSDERDNPPEKFTAVFARARAEGYRLTMHCDVDQLDITGHIRQCLDVIGVERIDHGVNVLESDELVAEVASAWHRLHGVPDIESLRDRKPQERRTEEDAGAGIEGDGQLRRSGLLRGLSDREPRNCGDHGGSQPDRARAAREEHVRDFVAADGSERRPPRRAQQLRAKRLDELLRQDGAGSPRSGT